MRSLVFVILLLATSFALACTKVDSWQLVSVDTYYAGIAGSLTGDDLKVALNDLIRGHKRQSYSCVWTMLKESDEDPINANNVIGFYTRRSIPKSMQDNGRNGNDAWNREHIWAKSHGFPSSSQHAYTDAHHLRPADKTVNSSRGNKDFDWSDNAHGECTACRSDSDSWEPPDVVKGDVARMMLYMAVRYEGDDASTPDLELVNAETDTGRPLFGWLDTLLQWHAQDPVSFEEQDRNEIIYSWQGNRNPFIDHPEYVARIWGGDAGDPVDPAPTWDYAANDALSNGQTVYHPNGTYFYTSKSGLHRAELVGPGDSVDFDLELYKWGGGSWQRVAYSWYDDPKEAVSYDGTAGYYIWSVSSYSGSGSYSFGYDAP